jgi:hypothetical protein
LPSNQVWDLAKGRICGPARHGQEPGCHAWSFDGEKAMFRIYDWSFSGLAEIVVAGLVAFTLLAVIIGL